jgi:hypothetical protein
MYFLYKNEYRIFKPVVITIRGLSRKEKSKGEEPIWVIIHIYIRGNVTMQLPV